MYILHLALNSVHIYVKLHKREMQFVNIASKSYNLFDQRNTIRKEFQTLTIIMLSSNDIYLKLIYFVIIHYAIIILITYLQT